MANMAKQTREQLGVQPGDKIVLKGKVAFARVDKAVTGEALARENERRAKLGMMKTKEFRSISIEEPEIVQGEGTPLANFHSQEVYTAKGTGKPTMSFESKSLFAPSYGHMQENGSILEIADPEKNPAQGQVVYLMISAFAPKGFNNMGSTFDSIVFAPGEIKFYEGSNGSLAGFGQMMNMPVERMGNSAPQTQPVQETVPQEQLVGAGVGVGAGFGQGQDQSFGVVGQGQGFGQAPTNDPNQQPETNQAGFGGFSGGFGQPNPAQGQGTTDPFGVQEGSVPNQGSPFGGGNGAPFGNNGQRGQSPYA